MRAHLAALAARFDSLLRCIDGLAADREALQSAREVALNDVDLLLRLRMGQARRRGDGGGQRLPSRTPSAVPSVLRRTR